MLLVFALGLHIPAAAQTDPTPTPPQGKVLFERHTTDDQPSAQTTTPDSTTALKEDPTLTGAVRASIRFLAYDLDARLTPAQSTLIMRAHITLRNTGPNPLTRIVLQISSSLTWESATLLSTATPQKLNLTQHLIDTDADHTGRANEAFITLPTPLAPGATLTLDTFYAGPITPSANRLQRIGATATQALDTDWDAITPTSTALRGFGNVLWYPVAAPQLFLGEAATLFTAVNQARLDNQSITLRLRLTIAYQGDPPAAAYLSGRRQALTALPDDVNMPISIGTGLATADFTAEPIGFRIPSLFLINQPERLAAPIPTIDASASNFVIPAAGVPSERTCSLGCEGNLRADGSGNTAGTPTQTRTSSSNPAATPTIPNTALLAVETDDESALTALAASAENVAPLLQQWLGAEPLSALTVIDHPGQPFEDGPLLVGPAATLASPAAAGALTHSLTHAWIQTGRPWMDEGLAEFFTLLWTEHETGRDHAIAQLDDLLQPLSLAEPAITQPAIADPSPATTKDPGQPLGQPLSQPLGQPLSQPLGQPLISASAELYYRRKSAAVWWMLREIAGDDELSAALTAWRQRTPTNATAETDAQAFEALLEKSGRNAAHPIDLHWFFRDWVLHDRGLPDLSITAVAPRELPMGAGHTAGYLVAVSIRNDGAAEAQVPVTLRSATFSTTSQLRIPAFSSATARVITETLPTEVQVNDGITPEVRTSFHLLTIGSTKKDHQ